MVVYFRIGDGTMKIEYQFSDWQLELLREWEQEQDRLWVESKKMVDPQDPDEPYYGAIGGSRTYMLTPTGIGMIVVVKHANGAELDLTDYDAW